MKKAINISDVSNEIRRIIADNAGLVKKVGIFGPLARGNFDDSSDIDILIEYAETPDFKPERYLDFCKLCNEVIDGLDERYGRSVDLVHFEENPVITLFNESVEEEVVWI